MKPKILRSEEVATDGSKVIPTMLGVSAGCQPRFLSVANYRDERNDVTIRSNYFGQIMVASPVDGMAMTQVDTITSEITADELHASTTQVGSCDHCSTDIFASNSIAPELAGTTGHCTMCGSDVAFEAITPLVDTSITTEASVEAASDDDSDDAFADDEDAEKSDEDDEADTSDDDTDDTTDSSDDDAADEDDSSTEEAGDVGADRYAFDDMVLVNEDEEEHATMKNNKTSARAAIADALRKTLNSKTETANADAPVEQPATPEANAEAPAAELATDDADADSTDEDDLEEDDLPAMSSDDEDEDDSEDEDTEEANVAAPLDDQPISDYQAVDIQTVDLSQSVLLPTTEAATMYVMIDDVPALRLSRETASEVVQSLWDKPTSLRDALTAAFANTQDRVETLATFGGSVVTVKTSMRAHAAQVLARFTAKAEAEVAAMNSDNVKRFTKSLEIASLGVIKNMFPEHTNPMIPELASTLERHGVRNPQALVLAAVRDTLPEFVATIIEKASELAVDTDDVLTRTSALVGNAPFPVELPMVVANTTDTATAAAPAVPATAPALEIAAAKPDLQTAMRRMVNGLGR